MIRALQFDKAESGGDDRAVECCHRWKGDVYAFCQAFIGDITAAEEATCEILLAFCRQRTYGEAGAIQARIMRIAFETVGKWKDKHLLCPRDSSRLEVAILHLPDKERAVVIMRSLLRMDWVSLTLATGSSGEEVHGLWARGVSQLNQLLSTGDLKRPALMSGCGS